ncbi:hypothetical protein HELRODRAFT_194502 [Helobdella robusta]|uniref:Tetraspanin n=1 Tax=Helobdella robusta TaxID=6412 RepID=T1FW47_HELRO|nr:hypothetical protein HELRODRAFT_194502 [Helobdella robusta]ESN91877.1 hypothetical protein HELRODRAFT_194502 [Helobdella robusta]
MSLSESGSDVSDAPLIKPKVEKRSGVVADLSKHNLVEASPNLTPFLATKTTTRASILKNKDEKPLLSAEKPSARIHSKDVSDIPKHDILETTHKPTPRKNDRKLFFPAEKLPRKKRSKYIEQTSKHDLLTTPHEQAPNARNEKSSQGDMPKTKDDNLLLKPELLPTPLKPTPIKTDKNADANILRKKDGKSSGKISDATKSKLLETTFKPASKVRNGSKNLFSKNTLKTLSMPASSINKTSKNRKRLSTSSSSSSSGTSLTPAPSVKRPLAPEIEVKPEKSEKLFNLTEEQKNKFSSLERDKNVTSREFNPSNSFWQLLFALRLIMFAIELIAIKSIFSIPQSMGTLLSQLPSYDDKKQKMVLGSWFVVSATSNLLGAAIAFNSKHASVWTNKSYVVKTYIFWLTVQLAIHLVGLSTCTWVSQSLHLTIVPPDMKIFLTNYKTNADIKSEIDRIQLENNCCGMTGPIDWIQLPSNHNGKLPSSCCQGFAKCRHIIGKKINIDRKVTQNVQGCYNVLMDEIEAESQTKALVFGILIVLQLPLYFLTLDSLPNMKILSRYFELIDDFKQDVSDESMEDLPTMSEMKRGVNQKLNYDYSYHSSSRDSEPLDLTNDMANNSLYFRNLADIQTLSSQETTPNSVEPHLREIATAQELISGRRDHSNIL